MGDKKTDVQAMKSFVWFIKDFVNYKLDDEIVVATGTIELVRLVKRQQYECDKLSMVLRKDKSCLNFKIKNYYVSNFGIRDEGKVTLAVLTPNLHIVHEYSAVLDNNKESEISFSLENLMGNSTVLFYGRHLILSGTISFNTRTKPDKNDSILQEMSILRQTLSALLESGTFHDFTMEVQNKKFPCHKAILACRSEYFRLLFQEKGEIRNLKFLDTEPDVFEKILKYIYTGEVKITEYDVLHLLDDSEIFSLTCLKDICEEKLISYFSLQNVFKMLDISSAYELINLKELSLCLITIFSEDIQISRKDTSQNSCSKLEANNDLTVNDHSVTNLSPKAVAVNQPLDLTETPTTSSGKKLCLPSADVWYTEESRVIFRNTWVLNINEKEDKHFTDDETNSTFKLFHTLQLKQGIKMTHFNASMRKIGDFNFALHLKLESSARDFVNIRYKFAFANEHEGGKSMVFEGSCCCRTSSSDCLPNSFLSVGTECIPISDDGIVSLKCIILFEDTFSYELKQSSYDRNNLIRDISSLCLDEDQDSLKDLEIRFGKEEKFFCHKAIVLSLCPFLKQKMKEIAGKGVIILDDKGILNFRTFLSFLYGNNCGQSADSLAWELLPCSHAFQMDDLRKACEENLVSQLDLKNALKAYDFSKKYDLLKLEEASIKLISNNFKLIIKENRSHELFKDSRLLRAVWKQP